MGYQIFKLPKAVPLDSNAELYAGAKAYFYQTGTSTPQDTFQDADLTNPHENPVEADGFGVFPVIHLDSSKVYKSVITTAAGVVLPLGSDPCNDQMLSQAVIGGYLYPQTDTETSAGVTPVNYAYPEGKVQRYDPSLEDAGNHWYCFGQAATRVSDTAFTVVGNYTSRYFFSSRIRLTDNAGGVYMGRVRNSTFGSGVTRVVVGQDGNAGLLGNVPATITSLCREESPSADGANSISYSGNGSNQGTFVWNRDTSATAYGELQVHVGQGTSTTDGSGETIFGSSSGVAFRVTPTSRTNSLLNGGSGYGGGGVGGAGASVVLHTGLAIPIIIGTNDQERLIITAGTSAILFANAEEAARFISPRVDDTGGVYITFYEDDNTTRKGYIGFANGGSNDQLVIVQEENAALFLSGGTKHAFSNANKAFVFDVLDEYADDAAASAGGVEVGELYRTGSAVKQRVA